MGILDANYSPEKISNNKRLSKVPIVIVVVIVIAILLSIVYVAITRQQNLNKPNTENITNTTTATPKKDINSYITSLEESSKNKFKPMQTQNIIEENITEQAPIKPIEKDVKNNKNLPLGDIKEENQLSEFESREFELKKEMKLKALTSISKLGINTEEDNKIKNTENYDDLTQNLLKNLNPSLNNQNSLFGETAEINRDEKAEVFLAKNKDLGYLKHIKQKPFSKYEIKSGWTIPAIMITGINSDIPGQILAQISQNVYDTASGKFLLIPQGTKAVGNYSSNIVYGQKRILIAWSKLIFPNGDTLNLENMQGASVDGYSGFKDQVDNHYFRIFGSAFLLSSISAGISLTDNSDKHQTETASDKAISAAINQIGQVASEMIRKNMNIAPTLKIRPGYKFNIFVTKDIILEPLELKND